MSSTQTSNEHATQSPDRRDGRSEARGRRHSGVRRRSRQALLRELGVAAGRRFRRRRRLAGGAADTSRLAVLDPSSARESRRPRRARLRALFLVVVRHRGSTRRARRPRRRRERGVPFRRRPVQSTARAVACRARTRSGDPTAHSPRSAIRTATAGCSRRSRRGFPDEDSAAGRRDADRASARGGGAPWRVRTDRSEAPLVGLVRRLHRRARAAAGLPRRRPKTARSTWKSARRMRRRHRSRRRLSRLRAVGPPRQAPHALGVAGRRSAGAGALPRRVLSEGPEATRRAPATASRDAGRLLPSRDDLDRQPARDERVPRWRRRPLDVSLGPRAQSCRRISTSRNTPTRITIR